MKNGKKMVDEYKAVMENGTWKLVDFPLDVEPIGCKWVYLINYNPDWTIDKYKEIFVAKGFAHHEGIDYEEMFVPTTKWNAIKMVINLLAQNWCKVHQMDVKSSFLNGDL